MNNLKNKKAIFFDFGDTIATTVPTYPDRIRIALNNLGFDFTKEDYFKAYQYADYVIYKNYIEHGTLSSAVYQDTIMSILTEKLEIGLELKEANELVRKELKNIEFTRELLPGAADLLGLLNGIGYKLGIISNNDGRTGQKCRELGIDKYFEVIVDSTNVKKVKPDIRIFNLASEKIGIDSKETVHIGDLYGADVLGALNAGLDIIWINGRDGENYENLDLIQVRNLFELKELFI